jgi:Leu/Phe-tRNA-protein transferase
MSESADDPEIFWVEPDVRGIIPLDTFHVLVAASPRQSAKGVFEIRLRLKSAASVLLDTQFTTEHLKRFGAIDVSRKNYEKMLAAALTKEAKF